MNQIPLWKKTKAWALDLVKAGGYQLGALPNRYQLYSAMKICEFEIVAANLHLPAQATLVDVCCGTGIQTQLLARQADKVIGIDSDQDKIRDACWHLRHSRFRDSVSFIAARAEALPLADRIADAVVCLCALEHIPEPEVALAEMNRILRPGGMLFITADSLANVTSAKLRMQHQSMYEVFYYFDVRSLSELLQGAGFHVKIAFPMLCSLEAVKELERCMAEPRSLSAIRTRRLLLRLREGDLVDRSGGLFVFAAATKLLQDGVEQ